MTSRKALTEYVSAFTHSLVELGVAAAVISPGSRSTPLAYACMKQEGLTVYRQIDERSAAYFALGMAKASGKPVMLLCTSGTAAANYFPAVVEAYYARVPLIVVTADRPHELREVGAPQAINQINLFGSHVKWSTDLPMPETENQLAFLTRHLHRSVQNANSEPRGPVHINVPFREPLGIDFEQTYESSGDIAHFGGELSLSAESRVFLQNVLKKDRGLLIVGEMTKPMPPEFWEFVQKLNWPVLADPLSNLRGNCPSTTRHLIVDSYDALLKNKEFKEQVTPQVVFRIGPQPVSKPLSLFLAAARPETYVVFDESPMLRDAQSVATHHIQASINGLWQLSLEMKKTNSYREKWTKASSLYWKVVALHSQEELDEGVLAKVFFDTLENCDLIIGSSMPIRDVDTFFQSTERDVMMYANRGTNGIDGVVSTAFGVQAAKQRPAYLYIGDLSFLHDMNGLIASKMQETDLTIVVMNNDGGGIFSYLPQSQEERHFEELFGTPTGLTFSDAANMYDAQYVSAETIAQFAAALDEPKTKSVKIIEVFTNRENNVMTHRKLWSRFDEELAKQ
ncbi:MULTISPECIES: 2-succinyl-5-enolpyruvyl-6-hydroxy-3-cyclohexene-1-carboxylic-acid synthase [Planococcus]|uniref:2-succinyl-5-enolpyruvyl-6-hydroxy-3-cyclohexene-1-carboxylate synthase n=1 Tax=Planococcus faecalis TaxID=1598147 RepID=A0ABN4XGF0_9BACL|nr:MULTISPECIES: 2-succinyl-5-enolpyruvyl-6-hydroxy-3-cyclohexene-1-carboxylic-acid synthase [Planococcus]AQU78856.1 2-succinyl-5-enolpyruvyl-6-hydroxy-3-cyclohexene-1-carboxylic-acid synthase [Planococcus faecalis]MDJ0333078.1 2-succinyl-5-enolpyruvyl-6-hydroxy-3-cyclohexene-1-carboxylic-acid synthase [Planococcus sp. S3-L1]